MASPFDLGFAYGLGFQKGKDETKKAVITFLVFDFSIAPEGFEWRTLKNNQRVLMSPGGYYFRELTPNRAKSVCRHMEKSIRQAKSPQQVRDLLQTTARLLAGYVDRDFNGETHPVLINQKFHDEIGRYYTQEGMKGAKGKLEDHKKLALGQLEGLRRIVSIIQTGGDITPVKSGWNYDPERHKDTEFYTIGAKVIQYPSGVRRFILDLARKVGKNNTMVVAYHLNFQDRVGYKRKKEGMEAQALKEGRVETLNFFED